ncbi:hypothetical protein Pelo_8869 [Pelomyxa schiedti]|nr:hypothetical protein Pelo_8869 [Pelomyxa schiedti]
MSLNQSVSLQANQQSGYFFVPQGGDSASPTLQQATQGGELAQPQCFLDLVRLAEILSWKQRQYPQEQQLQNQQLQNQQFYQPPPTHQPAPQIPDFCQQVPTILGIGQYWDSVADALQTSQNVPNPIVPEGPSTPLQNQQPEQQLLALIAQQREQQFRLQGQLALFAGLQSLVDHTQRNRPLNQPRPRLVPDLSLEKNLYTWPQPQVKTDFPSSLMPPPGSLPRGVPSLCTSPPPPQTPPSPLPPSTPSRIPPLQLDPFTIDPTVRPKSNNEAVKGKAEIFLSSDKIFRHKKFQMVIKIDKALKNSLMLSNDDIFIAGLNARVCREKSEEEVESCMQCSPTRKLLVLNVSPRSPFYPGMMYKTNPNADMEEFIFDECHSNCSSSRFLFPCSHILSSNLEQRPFAHGTENCCGTSPYSHIAFFPFRFAVPRFPKLKYE